MHIIICCVAAPLDPKSFPSQQFLQVENFPSHSSHLQLTYNLTSASVTKVSGNHCFLPSHTRLMDC